MATAVFRVLIAMLCLSACAIDARADEGLDDYNYAIGLYKEKRYPLAEEAFQDFLTNHKTHSRVPLGRLYLGLTQVQLQKWTVARNTLQEFVTKHSKSTEVPTAEYRIAECSYHLRDYKAAVVGFSKFVRTQPKDPLNEWAWAWLGDSQRQLKQYDDAIISFKRSLADFEKGRMADESRFGLGQVYEARNNLQDALTMYRLVASNPGSARAPVAQLRLSNVYFGQQDYKRAAVEYQKLVSEFPKSRLVTVAQLNAGFSYYQLGDHSQALREFDKAESNPKQAVVAGYWKGLSLKALGDFSSAAKVLETVSAKAKNDPLLEQIVYQMADCHFQDGNLTAAEKRFLEVTSRWPKSRFADHSLYFATECALDQVASLSGDAKTQRLKDAELLLAKFDRDYAQSRLKLSHEMQRAQYFVLRGNDGDLDLAQNLFEQVMKQSGQDETKGRARYQLAKLLRSRDQDEAAFAILRPLVEEVIQNPETGFPESLILYCHLAIETGNMSIAITSSQAYLRDNPGGKNRDQAWAYQAIASAKSQSWANASQATTRLLSDHSDSPLVSRTIQSVADVAYDTKQWDESIRFFSLLAKSGPESPYHAPALSGLAWSFYSKGDFDAAAARFADVVAQHKEHALASESAFQIGDSLIRAGKKPEGIAAFRKAFSDFQPDRNAFLAGLQVARILARSNETDEADKAYEAVAAAFEKAPERDQLLNEWALVLYEAEKYAQSDAIFARLIKEHPKSEIADNARFSLAESDLVGGKTAEARQAFTALAASSESDREVQEDSLFRLIGIEVEAAQWKDVARLSNDLTKRFPKSRYSDEVQFQLGNARLNLGELSEAERILSALERTVSDPNFRDADWLPHVWLLLAEAQVSQKSDPGKPDDVLQTAERFRKTQPESPLAYRMDELVGRAHMRKRDFDKAREAFRRVVQSKSGARTRTAAKAQFLIGESLLFQKQHQQAQKEYLRVYLLYRIPEWQAPALYQAAQCELTLKNVAEAKETLKKLVKEFPDSEYATKAAKQLSE